MKGKLELHNPEADVRGKGVCVARYFLWGTPFWVLTTPHVKVRRVTSAYMYRGAHLVQPVRLPLLVTNDRFSFSPELCRFDVPNSRRLV